VGSSTGPWNLAVEVGKLLGGFSVKCSTAREVFQALGDWKVLQQGRGKWQTEDHSVAARG
jgi:hypothetical protein